ncbi:hypothetical protein Ga0074115_1131 [endosymbiont of Ridgeia piscesae]|jgi:hypothetical protein|uniref:Uncharacterized protein n=1 Tax=endosymbiont of Ridgeia piscesae TaxID=54398 RepID=A0A0T5YY27_9GAMM|nr:hypothetical protein Ga0074115_1131 [endosymbiont of Ridgeia piscesae]
MDLYAFLHALYALSWLIKVWSRELSLPYQIIITIYLRCL